MAENIGSINRSTGPADGGPAFGGSYDKVLYNQTTNEAHTIEARVPGMSLRDYFAAKAMHAYLCQRYNNILFNGVLMPIEQAAYAIADVMLLERMKGR